MLSRAGYYDGPLDSPLPSRSAPPSVITIEDGVDETVHSHMSERRACHQSAKEDRVDEREGRNFRIELGQADTAGIGVLAFGSYDSEPPGPGGSIGSPLSWGGGTLPAPMAALIKANAGFAAVLSGKATITDRLEGASATLIGALSAASAMFTEGVKAASVTRSGALDAGSATFTEG
jgi:hypothetical protein